MADPVQLDQVRAILEDLAEIVRDVRKLETPARRALANVLHELAEALDAVPEDENRLGEQVREFAKALDQQRENGLFSAAKESIEEAVVRAESEAPAATVFAQRLLNTLANLGI